MSNLKISFPDIPARALTITTSEDFGEDTTIYNSVSGYRYTRSSLSALATSTLNIDFDMGTGVTASSDHLIVGHADQWLQAPTYDLVSQINVLSDTSSSFGTATTVYANSSLGAGDLTGPDNEDFVATWSSATARQFWRIQIDKSNAAYPDHSKLYLGTLFDPGIDLTSYSIDYAKRPPFLSRTNAGAIILGRRERPRYSFSIAWEGVTDSLLASFSESIGKIQHKHIGVFLYCPTGNEALDGHSLVHCEISSIRMLGTQVSDWNRLELSLEEFEG